MPIPDGVSYHHAGMACCGLGSTSNAMRLMNINAFDTVLITGMGPIGLGGVINAVYRGARVIAVESHPYRAALAKKLGAAEVVNPQDADVVDQIWDLTGGRGADKGVECSAASAAVQLLIEVTRPKGHISLIGGIGEVAIQGSSIINKGLTLHGTRHYNLIDTPDMMQMIPQVKAQLDTFITHTFPMSQIQDAWAFAVYARLRKSRSRRVGLKLTGPALTKGDCYEVYNKRHTSLNTTGHSPRNYKCGRCRFSVTLGDPRCW